MDNVEYPFMCLLAICMSSSLKYLFMSFAIFHLDFFLLEFT